MSDIEFDVMDELYFLQSYQALEKQLNLPALELRKVLESLLAKGWVRCYKDPDIEVDYDPESYQQEYRNYYYLASKAGLLAHNSDF
jgi:hypothetical protein